VTSTSDALTSAANIGIRDLAIDVLSSIGEIDSTDVRARKLDFKNSAIVGLKFHRRRYYDRMFADRYFLLIFNPHLHPNHCNSPKTEMANNK
jgi:hypothetical protein